MSDLPGNPYDTPYASNNTQATLALAYEQRTANLLKCMELVVRTRPEGVYPSEADAELQARVMKRLGLNGEGDD